MNLAAEIEAHSAKEASAGGIVIVASPRMSSVFRSATAKPNSVARRGMMDPYHDIAASVFEHNVEEMERIFLNAAKVRRNCH